MPQHQGTSCFQRPNHQLLQQSRLADVTRGITVAKQQLSYNYSSSRGVIMASPQSTVLPPIMSENVWRRRHGNDPATEREREVDLTSASSPRHRFPLLTSSVNRLAAWRASRRLQQSRALPVCLNSDCRVLSVSWDDTYFAARDPSAAAASGVGSEKTAAAAAARAGVQACNIDASCAGCRSYWKSTEKGSGKKTAVNLWSVEENWKRQHTQMFLKHVSTLLKTK